MTQPVQPPRPAASRPTITRRGLLSSAVAAGTVGAVAGLAATRGPARASAGTGAGRPAAVPAVGGGEGGAVALTGVTVVDPAEDRTWRDVTVLVDDGEIRGVGRYGDVAIPDDAEVIDGRGKFVLPGLCDMHMHSGDFECVDPALYLAAGVTTVREMSGRPTLHEWRRRIAEGTLVGPRWSIASPLMDGSPSLWEGLGVPYVEVADAEQARGQVRAAVADGADFVKVYTRLSPEAFHAVASECGALGVPFAGHCPDDVPVLDAVEAGQRSFEHMFTVWYATSSQEADIRRQLAAIKTGPGDYNGWFHRVHPLEWTAANSYDPTRAAAVFGQLARHEARVVPTLTLHRVLDRPDTVVADDERLRYVPAAMREGWEVAFNELYLAGRTSEETAQHRELFDHRLRYVDALRRGGVPLMAGTDTGTSYCFAGFSLHDELALLVEAGLSPMRALRAATYEPARYLGWDHVLGSVRPGNQADLVVLDADPLLDVRNTQQIHSVFLGGRLIGPERREQLLADAEAAAARATDAPAVTCPCGVVPR